jgi:hypothetical protein
VYQSELDAQKKQDAADRHEMLVAIRARQQQLAAQSGDAQVYHQRMKRLDDAAAQLGETHA